MKKLLPTLSLWLLGLAIMVIGAACPIYLFSVEGYATLLGNVIYVLAGVLLFLAGLSVTVFRTWLLANARSARRGDAPRADAALPHGPHGGAD